MQLKKELMSFFFHLGHVKYLNSWKSKATKLTISWELNDSSSFDMKVLLNRTKCPRKSPQKQSKQLKMEIQ